MMTRMIIWHNNGNPLINEATCGFTEEVTNESVEEVRSAYEAAGITVFSIDAYEEVK